MPEGPEGKTADDIVFEGCDPQLFVKCIQNKVLLDTIRRGKLFYLVFDEPPFPLLHFGMTGSILIKGQEPPKFKDFQSDQSTWPPRFWKFILDFDNGHSMAFTDCRRLGRIRLQHDPPKESPMKDLGFDPITDTPNFSEFCSIIESKSCPIKALLLDQSFSAGVGNWTADEILYQSGIHPSWKCNTLSSGHMTQLYEKMLEVMRKAVEWNADSELFPNDWLFHYRWSKGSRVKPIMPNGNSVIFETVAGRTSAIVPAVQTRSHKSANDEEKLQPSRKRTSAQHSDQEKKTTNRRSKRNKA